MAADIEITGNARGALTAIDSTRRALQSLASTAPSAAEAARWKASGDNINAWKRAASGVAPQLTGIIDSMEEYAEGAEKVGGASMAARVGLLGVASAGMAVATAVAAGAAAVVASSLDIIAHVDQMDLSLSEHRAELLDAHDAYIGLGAAMTDLRVEVAGALAPALTTAMDAMSGVLITAVSLDDRVVAATTSVVTYARAWSEDLAEAMDTTYEVGTLLAPVFSAITVEMARQIPYVGRLVTMYDALEAFAGIGADARADTGPGGMFGTDRRVLVNMEAEAAAAAAADEEAARAEAGLLRARESQTAATHASTTAQHAHTAAIHEQVEAYHDLAGVVGVQSGMATTPELPSATVHDSQMGLSGETSWGMAADDAASAAESTEDSWRGAMGTVATVTGQALEAVSALWGEFAKGQTQITDDMSASERRHARERFKRQKAAAIGEAWIKSGLAFLTTMAEYPYPANLILAIAGAAVSSVQIGIMASRQMTAHSGRMLAPDEVSATTVLRSEQVAVVPRRGGGVTSADVARRSTGERTASAAPVTIVQVVMDGAPRATRPFGGMSPMIGRAVTT